ncbi:hypothetical protein C6501_19165 [Candidatus Poribacteria bacterium]|nr:MAG: hypothetical protein C6501_19165 [Candidatus Poribacteria bacterium]
MLRNLCLLGFAALLIFAVSFTDAVEQDDILVYYSFDKLDGDIFKDDSGNGNDAKLTGNGKLVDGQFKKAIHLNGGVVQLSPANDFIVPIGENGQITMEAWFFMNSHANHSGIISIEVPGGNCCEFRTMVNPDFKPFWDAGHHKDKSLGNFTFELKEWYHYVLVANGKDGKIYINGEFIGSKDENIEFPKWKQAEIFVGAGETPNHHKVEDAIIDEVVIYSKALTAEEVKASMELGVAGVLAVEAKNKLAVTWGQLKESF